MMPRETYHFGRGYRYGFNGKEKDNEVKGQGNSYDFGARMYDPRIGRWLTLDNEATKYLDESPYSFALNNPLRFIDPSGDTIVDANKEVIRLKITKEGLTFVNGTGSLSRREIDNLKVIASTRIGRRFLRRAQRANGLIYPKVSDKLRLISTNESFLEFQGKREPDDKNPEQVKRILKGVEKDHFKITDITDAANVWKLYGLTVKPEIEKDIIISEVFTLSIFYDTDEEFARELASIVDALLVTKTINNLKKIDKSIEEIGKVVNSPDGPGQFKAKFTIGVASTGIHELGHAISLAKGGSGGTEKRASRVEKRFQKQLKKARSKSKKRKSAARFGR